MVEDNFINYSDLRKTSFEFKGNYRAIVEETKDPDQLGRVRVRVLGIHSLDPAETPVSHLPWAEPALSLYYGGGQTARKNLNETVENENEDRYYPRLDLKNKIDEIPPSNTEVLVPNDGKWSDPITEECGASAIYTVPRKGSIVWVFFENESHLRPHYWAAAPKGIDWTLQRDRINEVIQNKREELDAIREEMTSGDQSIDKSSHTDGTKPVERIRVETSVPDPKLFIHNLDGIRNEDITSFTTAFGTTHIIVNTNGQERTYMFHRGQAQYVDHKGQVKSLIGKSDNSGDEKRNETDSDSSEQENDFQEMVANNYDLHILGDFNTYIHNNYFLDVEKDFNAVVKRNFGIVIKDGDGDILVEKGHVNISAPNGNANVHCQELQAKIEKNAILDVGENVSGQVAGDTVLHVAGSTNIQSEGDINYKTSANMNFEAAGDINMKAANKNEQYSGTWKLTTQAGIDISSQLAANMTGGSSSLNLNAGIASVSGPNANIFGSTVTIGGAVTMGGGSAAQPAAPTAVAPITIDAWMNWQPSEEKVAKNHEATDQVVSDEDSPS